MEKIYTVKEICGDYAILLDSDNNEVNISTFLLPDDITLGDKIISTVPFQYEKLN